MPTKNGLLPCYRTITTRIDERDFEALSLAVSKSTVNQTEFLRRIIRQYLATNAETPAA